MRNLRACLDKLNALEIIPESNCYFHVCRWFIGAYTAGEDRCSSGWCVERVQNLPHKGPPRSHSMGTPTNTVGTWRFGTFEFDAQSGDLRRSGVLIKLRDQSSRILLYLLEHAGQVVTREELRPGSLAKGYFR
jgi:hypothetical protein